MPHRKGLGEQAADQRAESELGRLVLRGHLDSTQGLAGETYLALWRGYVMSIAGPAELGNGAGHGFTCDGCEVGERYCRCEFRRRVYAEASGVLRGECGFTASVIVHSVVLHDLPVLDLWIEPLRLGLSALARHFGLTARANNPIGKISIGTASSPGP